MSPYITDFSAGEGLRRVVLLRNAHLADRRHRQQTRQRQLQLQQEQQQLLDMLNSNTIDEQHADHTPLLTYPWQQHAAPLARSQLGLGLGLASSAATGSHYHVGSPSHRDLAASSHSSSSASSSSSSSSSTSISPSSSISSLEASIIEEREQAWFDDVLSELENGAAPVTGPTALLSPQDDDDDDDEELLASITNLSTDDGFADPTPPPLSHPTGSLSDSVLSLRSSSTSLDDDLPELIQDDEDSSDDDDEVEDRADEATIKLAAPPAPSIPGGSTKLAPPAPIVTIAAASLPASHAHDRHNRSLLLASSSSIPLAPHQSPSEAHLDSAAVALPSSVSVSASASSPLTAHALDKLQHLQLQHAHSGEDDAHTAAAAMLRMLPPVFAFPAASPLRAAPRLRRGSLAS